MVDILMATYNGGKYIVEQIDSILNQNYNDWKLYIRDDGSKDNTINIVKEYIEKYPDKIILIEDGRRNLGPKLNFGELLKNSKSEYCMFCDQDDVWMEEKVSLTLNKMIELEKQYGKDKPILIHTDLKVVNERLDVINESFWNFMSLDPKRKAINKLLVENTITGCTMMINRKLKEEIKEIPEKCEMHDWWIALVASSIGVIYTIEKPTILYRQHENNQIGARQNSLVKKIIDTTIDIYDEQAKLLYDLYSNNMNQKDKAIVQDFIKLRNVSAVKRKYLVCKDGFFANKLLRNVKIVLFI